MVSHKKSVRKYYAVRYGNKPGVYHTYDDCLGQVRGFKGAIFKSFGTLTEAEAFVADQGVASTGTPNSGSKPKFYAVHRGIRPGVYRTWDEARAQIVGAKMPLQRAFTNLEDAEWFAKNGVVPSASSRPRKASTSAKTRRSRGKEEDEVEDEIDDMVEDEEDEVQDEPTMVSTATKRNREEVEEEDEVEEPKMQTKTPAAKRQKKTPAPALEETDATEVEQQEEPKPQTKTPATKKQKKTTVPAAAEEEEIDETAHAPGTGPLPKGAIDGFDPRVILTPITSQDGTPGIEYKFADQRNVWKMQPQGRRKKTCIDIYTDGSCRANGQGQRAVAGWGVYFGPYHDLNSMGPLPGPRQTNQRAELLAINKALNICPANAHVRIITDSQYSINCVTEWSKRWKKNDWKTATGKAVENKDLIEPIIAKVDERAGLGNETRFVWVKGHAGDEGNEGADKLAVEGAGMKQDSASYLEHVRAKAHQEKGIGEGVHQEDLEKKEPPSVADEPGEEDGNGAEAEVQAEEEEEVQAEEDVEGDVEEDVEGEVRANAAPQDEVPESVFADDASAAAARGPEILESVYGDGRAREVSREATEEL